MGTRVEPPSLLLAVERFRPRIRVPCSLEERVSSAFFFVEGVAESPSGAFGAVGDVCELTFDLVEGEGGEEHDVAQ